ncbi:MAG: hypothetical protein EXR54_01395 [Dehalococcoidia bacterium]|nr:hypothetical protein [Dehalococcoidia bacterium]
MAENPGKGSFVAFWFTLPGILTGLATLITAVGGLVTIILVSRPPSSPDITPAAATATPQPAVTQPATLRPPAGNAGIPNPLPATAPTAAISGAIAIQPGDSRGVAGPGGTVYHQFNVPPSSLAEDDVNSTQTCVQIAPLDAAGNPVFHGGGECATYGYFSILTSNTSGGVYFLRVVSGSAIAQGEYTVGLRLQGQDDAGSGSDVPGTADQAMLLSPNRAYQGLVGSQDPVDYYQFQGTASLKLECLYDEYDDVEITLRHVDAGGRVAAEERVRRDGLVDFAQRPAGRYLLRLSNQGQGAQYTLIFADGAGR